jgi:hypothetical protein
MAEKLELVREEKLFRLLPGRDEDSRLEASGVALLDEDTALVVFDNLNQLARIDLSLEPRPANGLHLAPGLSSGFEDVDVDRNGSRIVCLVEAIVDTDGKFRSFVVEFDPGFSLLRCGRLPATFDDLNKGFEGLAFLKRDERDWVYALEEESGRKAKEPGRIQAFSRAADGDWEFVEAFALPESARFDDYAGMACAGRRIAIVSQESSRLWTATLDPKTGGIADGSDAVFRFPDKSYGNVEGIAWLAEDMVVAVSDKKKSDQPDRCRAKDQSIHLFRIPR